LGKKEKKRNSLAEKPKNSNL